MSPIAWMASSSTLSGTIDPMILLNSLSSLTKKKEMKTTQKTPIAREPRMEATEPTTDVTEDTSNSLVIQLPNACCTLKSLPRAGKRSISQMLAFSSQRVISEALIEEA